RLRERDGVRVLSPTKMWWRGKISPSQRIWLSPEVLFDEQAPSLPAISTRAGSCDSLFLRRHRDTGLCSRRPNQDSDLLSQHVDLLSGFVRRAAVEDLRAKRTRC